MTDQSTIRLVIGGIIAMGIMCFGLYAWKGGDALIASGSACAGALASMLARTSSESPKS
jgi:hypothetical protein